jgi:hypothetical protein
MQSHVLFHNYGLHHYSIYGKILKPITCTKSPPGLSGNVMQLSIEEFWHQFKIKMVIVTCVIICSCYKQQLAETQSPCITRVICILFYVCLFYFPYFGSPAFT